MDGLESVERLQEGAGNVDSVDLTVFLRFLPMSGHPENSPEVNKLMEEIAKTETCDVWCLGCDDWRKANVAYAKYLQGEIESCRHCRGK